MKWWEILCSIYRGAIIEPPPVYINCNLSSCTYLSPFHIIVWIFNCCLFFFSISLLLIAVKYQSGNCHSTHNIQAVTACRRNRFFRIILRKLPSPLPPLSKGGGLTAWHKPLLYSVLLAIPPPFLFTELFCRQDGGIALRQQNYFNRRNLEWLTAATANWERRNIVYFRPFH